MFEHPYLILVLTGLAAACWQHLRSLGKKLTARLIDSATIYDADAPMASALLVHLRRYPHTRLGKSIYKAGRIRVRSLKRVQLVPYSVKDEVWIYWIAGRPISVAINAECTYSQLTCRWVRGTVDFEALLGNAADEAHTLIEQKLSRDRPSRFYVRRLTGYRRGTRGSQSEGPSNNVSAVQEGNVAVNKGQGTPTENANSPLLHPLLRYSINPVGFELSDLIAGSGLAGSAVSRLALSEEVLAAIDDVREWHASREWYEVRDIPWRHGLLLYGQPGCGKSRLTASLGQDLDLPILSFDLASLTNPEFIDYWSRAVRDASPCIALFEDIDAVFNGRENITGHEDGLTFDCFLNVLGGVEVADGVLVIITTNRPLTLDPAIAQIDGASRPGRIEAVVELGPPDVVGREQIARRVLADCLEDIEDVVEDGEGDSGAQFLDRCRVLALSRRRRAVVPVLEGVS